MVCNKVIKEAFEGIEFRYKLDDTLKDLGSQKFTAKQLEGYLTGKGVSPKEIKQSGIFKGFESDNRAIPASEWVSRSGSQRLSTNITDSYDYEDITLGRKGIDNNSYTINLSTIQKPSANAPSLPHFSNEIDTSKESLLGWRRTHVDEINGKKTLVLNEFQSDWAQTERAGRGTFESNSGKVADFPMSEIKHHQFQIVGAIDDAIKQGIDTVAIPIQRENELKGSAGVTKFYESLNTKILPDIRKKLEKQGLKISVDKQPYKVGTIEDFEKFKTYIAEQLEAFDIQHRSRTMDEMLEFEMDTGEKLDSIDAIMQFAKEYAYTTEIKQIIADKQITNELWVININEVPNSKVKWDVYGLLGSLGLTGYATQEGEQ